MGAFLVDQQAEPILEGQGGVLGITKLLFEGGAKSGHAKLRQFVEKRLGEHSYLLVFVIMQFESNSG
jgi:hypothetical protein